jgi:hypothetical protein
VVRVGRLYNCLILNQRNKQKEWTGVEFYIDVENGSGPVHAPCPMRQSLNPGRQTPQLSLLFSNILIIIPREQFVMPLMPNILFVKNITLAQIFSFVRFDLSLSRDAKY